MVFKSFLTWFLVLFLANTLVIASEENKKEVKTERSGYWTYYCINHDDEKHCKIARKINIEEQNEIFLIVYNVNKNKNSKVKENLSITTPPTPRIDMEKRLKITFDDKTKFTKSFSECKDSGCLVTFKGGKMLKYSLMNFKEIKIIFYFSEDEKSTSLTLPIDGFIEAINNINKQLNTF